jgi:hypothetical protein
VGGFKLFGNVIFSVVDMDSDPVWTGIILPDPELHPGPSNSDPDPYPFPENRKTWSKIIKFVIPLTLTRKVKQ